MDPIVLGVLLVVGAVAAFMAFYGACSTGQKERALEAAIGFRESIKEFCQLMDSKNAALLFAETETILKLKALRTEVIEATASGGKLNPEQQAKLDAFRADTQFLEDHAQLRRRLQLQSRISKLVQEFVQATENQDWAVISRECQRLTRAVQQLTAELASS